MWYDKSLYLFTVPASIVLAVFFVYPISLTVALSFTDSSGFGPASSVGFDNYASVLTSDRYLRSIWVALKFSFLIVVFQNLIGLIFAAILYRAPFVRGFCRATLFAPTMMSFVIVGYIWQFIYSPFGGALNVLVATLGFDGFQQNYLGNPDTAIYAVAAAHIWMFTGHSCAIFLAGFSSISEEVTEAAILDGVSSVKRFIFIELPLLKGSISVAIILSTIGSLKTFELPLIMTGGGPDGATRPLSMEIINSLFTDYRFGMASAMAIVMLIIVLSVSYMQQRYFDRGE